MKAAREQPEAARGRRIKSSITAGSHLLACRLSPALAELGHCDTPCCTTKSSTGRPTQHPASAYSPVWVVQIYLTFVTPAQVTYIGPNAGLGLHPVSIIWDRHKEDIGEPQAQLKKEHFSHCSANWAVLFHCSGTKLRWTTRLACTHTPKEKPALHTWLSGTCICSHDGRWSWWESGGQTAGSLHLP